MKYILLSLKGICRTIVYVVVSLIPRNKKMAIFGAWKGDRYCDNPKYMMLYLLENTDIKCVWVGKEYLADQMPTDTNFRFVKHGSLAAVLSTIRAQFIFICRWDEDVSSIAWQGGATRINLWHGIPLKYMGVKTPFYLKHKPTFTLLETLRHRIFDILRPSPYWTTTSSKRMSQIMVESFPRMFAYSHIFECGTPRNDFIIHNAMNKELRATLKKKYCMMLGIPEDKKIVLYMPTWRMRGGRAFTFFGLEDCKRERIARILHASSSVLVEKHHHVVLESFNVSSTAKGDFFVIGSSQHNLIDPQELYLVTDILITDYSSAYIDFALLKRPCIHFIYDYDEYMKEDSGLAYDLLSVAAGPCVKTFDELEKTLNNILASLISEPAGGFSELIEFEKGTCSAHIFSFMRKCNFRCTD